MPDQNTILSLLPTSGIQDPQVRNFCDRLVEAWAQLNGEGGVVKTRDFARLTGDAIAGAVGNNWPNPTGGSISSAIDTLAESIRKSVLLQTLEQRLRPEDLINQVRRIDAAIAQARAGVASEVITRENKDTSLASAVNRVWAVIGGSTAVIEDGELASATPSAAVATKWNQVVAAVTDPNTGNVASAAILEETRTYANNNDGTLNAIYSVRAQISSGGQTVVGGFGFAATSGAGSAQGPTIDFGVLANKFWIGAPASDYDPVAEYDTNNQFPFIVITTPTTLNGVTYPVGVYMKKAAIGEAAIDNAMIGNLIYSNNFNGTFDGSGVITGYGTLGWAMSKSSRLVVHDIYARGDIEASSLTADTVNTSNIVGAAVTSTYNSSGGTTASLSVTVPAGASALVVQAYPGTSSTAIYPGGDEGASAATDVHIDYGQVSTSFNGGAYTKLADGFGSFVGVLNNPPAGVYSVKIDRVAPIAYNIISNCTIIVQLSKR